MTNLLEDIERKLKNFNLSLADVLWIGNKAGSTIIPKGRWRSALNINYTNSAWAELPCRDLVIVARTWWLSMMVCPEDGVFWVYNKKPSLEARYTYSNRVMDSPQNGLYWFDQVIGLKTRVRRGMMDEPRWVKVPESYYTKEGEV